MSSLENFILSLNLYDYIILGLILYSILLASGRGFIKEATGIISLFLSISISKLLSMSVVLKVYEILNLKDVIFNKINTATLKVYDEGLLLGTSTLESAIDGILKDFSFVGNYAKTAILADKSLTAKIQSGGTDIVNDISLFMFDKIEPIILYILNVVAFLLLYIIIKMLFRLLSTFISDIIRSIPLVGSLNVLLGACVGLLRGVGYSLLFTYLFFLILSVFPNIPIIDLELLMASKTFNFLSAFKSFVKL